MLNVITDTWIPVRARDGARRTIAPWQMADPDFNFPDWPRPDLNIACLELLIGLVFLADPPRDADDWRARQAPDPDRLRAALAPYAPAFELLGDGPRFMQDIEALEDGGLQVLPAGRLFIDSGGENTFRDNKDIMVKRDRYGLLDPDLAAMALFTAQIYAYADSAKHKASLRGNGPLVAIVDPLDRDRHSGLWPLVWANVPHGRPSNYAENLLPWQKPTVVSGEGGRTVPWPGSHVAETFFSMPWRIRLVNENEKIVGFVRKDFGAKYENWMHPLTPYRRRSAGEPFSPVKARPGKWLYNNWLGVVLRSTQSSDDLHRRPENITVAAHSRWGGDSDVLVAGWAMAKATPVDFVLARAPLIELPDGLIEYPESMITAANSFAEVLRNCLKKAIPEKDSKNETVLNSVHEEFFINTQSALEARLGQLETLTTEDVMQGWLADMKGAALALFDAYALPGLGDADIGRQAAIVQARRNLSAAFAGHGKTGQAAYLALGLPIPEQGRRVA